MQELKQRMREEAEKSSLDDIGDLLGMNRLENCFATSADDGGLLISEERNPSTVVRVKLSPEGDHEIREVERPDSWGRPFLTTPEQDEEPQFD